MTYFYRHLIQIDEVISELDAHDIDSEERAELADLIHGILHHHVLNVILNHLPADKHQSFLDRFHANPADRELLAFLKQEIKADIEAEIAGLAARIKKDLLAEIKKSRKK